MQNFAYVEANLSKSAFTCWIYKNTKKHNMQMMF